MERRQACGAGWEEREPASSGGETPQPGGRVSAVLFSLPTSSLLPAFSSLSPSLSPAHAPVACVSHLSPHVQHSSMSRYPWAASPTPPHSQAESCAAFSAISGTFLY